MKKKAVIIIGILLLIILVSEIPLSAQKAGSRSPNIILVLMDDMGYGDLSVTGATQYKTPHIDQMAQNGIRFTQFYSPQAVCGASRAGILTGCYPNRLGISGAPGPNATTGLNEQEETIAELLKKKGYATAAYGKWHLGHLPPFLPIHHGFDEYFGIPYSNDMWPNHPIDKSYPPLPLIEGDKTIAYNPDQTQFTTQFTNRALQFIDKHAGQPFFIYLAHPMPHVPLAVSDKFKGKSQQGLFGDVMMEIDWSIGQIMSQLRKKGLEENTMVIVTSDNGPWINYGNHAGSTGGLREGKGGSFEGGQRVPCLMQWKGKIKGGIICNQLSAGIDILPTIAAAAGAQLPVHDIDGVNLWPLLKQEPDANPRKSFLYYYRRNDLEAITNGAYKLVFPHPYRTYEKNIPGENGVPGPVIEFYPLKDTLLYDLRRDPGERYNVIRQYPDVLAQLLKMADSARADLGDDLTHAQGKNRRPIGTLK